MSNRSTRTSRHIDAPCADVYRAITDANAVATWMVPDGMSSQVHAFDVREGGQFRISLTYEEPGSAGKTSAHTDTYHGRFVTLVPYTQVVQTMAFETSDDAMRGEMTVSYTLTSERGGTHLLAVHDKVPPGISLADNDTGWRMSLGKLAALVEAH
ncbi:MAG: SRPBCC family protein [Pseudomonadota bacterium]